MQRSRSKRPSKPPARQRSRAPTDPVADALDRIADVVGKIAKDQERVEKKLDRFMMLEGERHVVVNERLGGVEAGGKKTAKALEGLTSVVKINNELARQLHAAGVNDLGLVKEKIRKLELEIEQKRERTEATGKVEKV